MAFDNFIIVKNDYAKDNQPQYRMLVRDINGKYEAGAVWIKEHKKEDGTVLKYLSGQMKNEFQKEDGTTYHGFRIISEAEYNKLKANKTPEENEEIKPDDLDF